MTKKMHYLAIIKEITAYGYLSVIGQYIRVYPTLKRPRLQELLF